MKLSTLLMLAVTLFLGWLVFADVRTDFVAREFEVRK